MSTRTLSRDEVRTVYDRIGTWQDTQRFYEAPAFDALVAHAHFEAAESILEVGCGTGYLAARILREHAPPSAHYEGLDLSATMVEIARGRLTAFENRATVRRTDGSLTFDDPDGSRDRIIATYLLDLLSVEEARTFLRESHRLLRTRRPPGRLCLSGLTPGTAVLPRSVTALWAAVHAVRPQWLGGCRPVRCRSLLRDTRWKIAYHTVVTAWGIPSEVLIATPL